METSDSFFSGSPSTGGAK